MTIDEIKEARDKLAKDITVLIENFEVSTAVGVKDCHLDISPAINFTPESGPTTYFPSKTSCVIDLVV